MPGFPSSLRYSTRPWRSRGHWLGIGGRRLRVPAAAVVMAAAVILTGACDYQVALQPTGTPGPLGVRQVPGRPVDPASLISQVAQAALGAPNSTTPADTTPTMVSAPASSTGAPPSAAPAISPPPAAPAALSVAAPASTGGSSSPSQAAAPPAVSGAPAPTRVPAAPTLPPLATVLPPGSGTPLPSYTATAQPAASAFPRATESPVRSTETPAATPSPSASPKPSGPVQVYLPKGTDDFLYVGPTMPVDQALAPLAGQYEVLYFTPAGGSLVSYRPGVDAPPILPTNTLVRIGMKTSMSFVMTPPR
jgi:hypothetical protein